MTKHKACPYCGGWQLEVKPVWQSYRFVACINCRAGGPIAKTAEDAWKLWDQRRDPKLIQEVLF